MNDESTRIKAGRSKDATGMRVFAFWSSGSTACDLPAGTTLVIGRGDDCDLQIPDDSVSRRHALLHAGPPARIEDLGSANGTVVAELQLTPHTPVPLGASMAAELGDSLLFVRSMDTPVHPQPRNRSSKPTLDPPMQRVYELVDLVSKTTIPVLLLGETGVGKGVIAEQIHRRSPCSSGPFVRLNCAAIPETMVESELFGHERGAFSGATSAKPGLFESAAGGSILLDEIGDLPLSTQGKLLHAIDHGEALRVGALRPRSIDARFIAATNDDLPKSVKEGRFRQDLFFRLNAVTLTIPPLRERRAELPSLVDTFIDEACTRVGCARVGITDEALKRLASHAWPGNVRELRNVIVRATLFAQGGTIGVEHFEPERAPSPAMEGPADLHEQVRQLELRRISDALERCGQNQVEAAKMLGISRGTLRARMRELGQLPRVSPKGSK